MSRDFVARFEAGTLLEKEWTHTAHLTVAAWYVANYPPIEAGVRIRTGIRHLNECLGGRNTSSSGFHETLTEFWIRIVRARLTEDPAALPSNLWRSYYSIDLPKDSYARWNFVEPDLKPTIP